MLELSVPAPGRAIKAPNIPVGLIKFNEKLATAVLLNAKVANCVPVSPDRLGPTGRNPVLVGYIMF